MEGRAVDTIGPFLNIVARVCFTTQIDEYQRQNGFLHYHHPFTLHTCWPKTAFNWSIVPTTLIRTPFAPEVKEADKDD